MSGAAALFKKVSGRVQIHPHAQIEIGLGLTANHRGQMKDKIDPGVDQAGHDRGVGQVGDQRTDA